MIGRIPDSRMLAAGFRPLKDEVAMILEAVLYFVLGFLSAGLLALMISPAIWNRAVVLTKRKIESSVPLTLNEIQADKDQLRAEFAMSTRRLEMSVDELRNKASAQLAEISRKRDELSRYDAEKAERLAQIREVEAKTVELNRKLEEREMLLEETKRRHDKLQEQYVETLEQLSEMRNQLADKDDELTSQRIEIAARDTRIDALSDSTLLSGTDGDAAASKTKEQIAELKAELKRSEMRVKAADKEAALAAKEARQNADKLEKQKAVLNESRNGNSAYSEQINKLNRELMDEREKTVDLEARLATQALKMEALLSDASNQNVEEAVKSVREQVSETQKQLDEARSQRDALQEKLDGISVEAGENWASERQENALLRERMNDMAARIAAMTAEIEGPSSPINKMLAKGGKRTRSGSKRSEEIKEAAPGERISLAERIRAIQQASGSGR